MLTYVEFSAGNGQKLYVESEISVVPTLPPELTGKVAGVVPAAQRVISAGSELFEKTVTAVMQLQANAFCVALKALPEPPSEATIEFGLKASAELGNVVVSKASAEANYTIKLTWKTNPAHSESK